jgi:hypothetical protein
VCFVCIVCHCSWLHLLSTVAITCVPNFLLHRCLHHRQGDAHVVVVVIVDRRQHHHLHHGGIIVIVAVEKEVVVMNDQVVIVEVKVVVVMLIHQRKQFDRHDHGLVHVHDVIVVAVKQRMSAPIEIVIKWIKRVDDEV